MSLLVWVRLAKVLAVCLYATGVIGTCAASTQPDRRLFAYGFAGPGLGACWMIGFVLAYLTAQPLLSAFVLTTVALSLPTLHGVLYMAGKEGRRSAGTIALTLIPLGLTIALMILRPF